MARDNVKGRIPEDALDFAKLDFKKFKKKIKRDYPDIKKKDIKYEYYDTLLQLFPDTIDFLIRFGHLPNEQIQKTKTEIFAKMTDEDFVKFIKEAMEDGYKIENIMYYPIIIQEIVQKTAAENKKLLAQDPNAGQYDVSDMVELSQKILKKRIKKFKNANINEQLAFDILSVIPIDDALRISQNYRIRTFFDVLYLHAKTEEIDFKTIMKITMSDDYYPGICVFSLLERKEKFAQLTENQQKLYVAITNWVFDTMENEFTDKQLSESLRTYVNNCKRDEANGKGLVNRRYALSTLSETDYPRIAKAVQFTISHNDGWDKYF